ncbi:MAG: TetR/AcrR family transcriptional regulator [Deltaproteobacteria bacterium]|nr:TetR/AcrR family transcriptional regulator [Deltaproteobacteria bacterium]MBW2397314.1 TetR/AcrR family transcriptional regulator [Deltaproteobacteria bacterium]
MEAVRAESDLLSRGEQTRERILFSATGLFAARNFAPVTMRAIGEAAGLDNSSLYRHFDSKNDLAQQVLQRAMAGLAMQLLPTVTRESATLDGLVQVLSTASLYFWDHPDAARLVLFWVLSPVDAATGFDVSLPVDTIGEPSGNLYRQIAELVGQAREAGEIRDIAWPDAFVAAMGAVILRPATYGSLLTSQEPECSAADARRAWRTEVRSLVRGILAP